MVGMDSAGAPVARIVGSAHIGEWCFLYPVVEAEMAYEAMSVEVK